MKLIECKQGSAKWHLLRLGRATASHFDEIVTPRLFQPSAGAKGYRRRLLAEWLTGIPSDAAQSGFMDRGKDLEDEAARDYALERGLDVQKVGIVMHDNDLVAGSPDRLVGDDGVLEIKCPSASTHVRNLIDGMGGYEGQVQGLLWLTGRRWAELLSWHPEMPMAVVRVERNEEHIAALERHLFTFVADLIKERAILERRGCVPATRLNLPLAAMLEADPEPF